MVFDSLIKRYNGITYEVSNVERIYIKQALSLLPSHVLSKIISEGWTITVYNDVQELMKINSNINGLTVGLTEYEIRKVFVQTRNTVTDFKYTLVHELIHVYDCIIEGKYCNWKSEKYYNSEIENLIAQEGHLFSEHANSGPIEFIASVISRYIFNMTDFTQAPLTKSFIEKYFYMAENSLEQRLKNLENNAVTYLELDETYNRLKYSKLNKENDKYVIQLSDTSGGSSSGTSSNIIYDNNVTFDTSVSYFSVNKTTISYIKNVQLTDDVSGTWELKTVMGSNMGTVVQYRNFIVDTSNSYISDITPFKFTDLPNTQKRFYDYNESRTWTEWQECSPSLAPLEPKGILSNRIVVQVTCNIARSLGAYNYYVVFKELDKDELHVLNFYPVTNSANLNISDNVFYNYQTLDIMGVGGTSYVPKQPAVTKSSNKSLSSSTSSYWITNGDLKTCSSVAKLNNCYPSAKFDIICITCRPYIASSSSSAGEINGKIFVGIEESKNIITQNTQLTKVIDYSMMGNAVADGETQIWVADGYDFVTDIKPLLTNYDDSKS